MTSYERLKRFYTRANVLGTHWPDHRDEWLRPTRTDGRPDRVLDAGCGRGETLAEFKRFGVDVDYYGVDLGVGDPMWEFRVSTVADLHDLPFKSGSFDKVVCTQVLEHVDRPDVVLSELGRVIRPGGKIFLSLPFVWHLHQEPYDRYRFSQHALEYLIKRYGLVADSIRPMGGYFSVLRYIFVHHGLVTDSWPLPLKKAARPFSWAYQQFDRHLGGPLAYALDHLDREQKLTIGYFLIVSRPLDSSSAATPSLPDDPYRCPHCADDGAQLLRGPNTWTCRKCGSSYSLDTGIPILTKPGAYRAVTDRISFNH